MALLKLYRLYLSIISGAAVFFAFIHTWWAWLFSSVLFRIIWFIIESKWKKFVLEKNFNQHSSEFKQLSGPYGIRMINKAETDPTIKKSLCEVFTSDLSKLEETVNTLQMMDSLFQAGLRPDADQYQLHDLKLKYGKYRLEKHTKK